MSLQTLILKNLQLGFREVLAIKNNKIIHINTILYLPEFGNFKTTV